MKVRLEKDYKQYITLAEAPVVREIISDMKSDSGSIEEYSEMAIRAAYDGKADNIVILKTSAAIAKNRRVWDAYNDHSGELDIYIKATAYLTSFEGAVNYEYVIIGAYLSDIWQITGDNNKEIATHMDIRRFREVG